MSVRPVAHPSPDALKAFGLGKMDDTSAGVLIDHLDQCEDCRKAVASQSGDDFLKRLRQGHAPNATPAPAKSLSGITTDAKLPSRPTPLHNLPPELAEHPQYEVLRELGSGGMGVVYLAKNKLMDRLEVLKVVNKALLDRPGTVERFLREIRSAAKLSHANVVGAYSALQLGDVLAFAMEYVEGEDLAVLVKSHGPLPVAHACYYIQQAALGLQHAFEKNMVHRDIKPQNLILAREGKKHVVKILDFGLAKVTREKTEDTGLTGEGKMLGTPDYIAPEQTLDAASADIRADIYSLGCTLYYLLSGRPPFSAASLGAILLAHQMQEAKLLNLLRPEVPEELAAVVRQMMAKQPARRYQTPAEVARALAAFIKPGAQGGTTPKSSDLSVGEPESKAGRSVAPTVENVRRAAATTQLPPVAGWETLSGDSSASAEPRKSGAVRKRRPPVVPPTVRKKWLLGSEVGVGVLLLALLGLWAGGVFKVKTKDGTMVLENVPADAEVVVDGETVTIESRDGKAVAISVVAGKKHRLQVKKEGFRVFSEDVEIDAGDRLPIRVTLQPQPVPDKPVPNKPIVAPRPVPDKPAPVVEDVAQDKGFVPLFNGKDLTGWSVEYDDPKVWGVEDGVIVAHGTNRQQLGYLLSDRDYSDFILRLEFNLEDHAASGVVLRAVPAELLPHPFGNRLREHPVFMLEDQPERSEVTGTLHWVLDSTHVRPNCAAALSPPGSWNKMEIDVKGRSLHASVNGKPVSDTSLAEGALFKDKTVPALNRQKGRIGLLKSYRMARFRNIEIKELPLPKSEAPPAAHTAAEDKGFVPLFNGKDLTGWKTHPKQRGDWRVEKGILIGSGPADSYLYTDRGDYKNFHLRVETRINDGGNSGVCFRSLFGPRFPADNPRFLLGYEGQINSTHTDVFKTGSLYVIPDGVLVSVREAPVPPGQWLTLEAIAEGNHIVIKVNGTTTTDYTDEKRRFSSGHIALQQFEPQTVAEFRKIEIRELAATPTEELLPKGSVWKGTRSYRKGAWAGKTVHYEIHVRERDGAKFKAVKFDNGPGRNRLDIAGEINDEVLTWREGGLSFKGTLNGNTIQFQFKGSVARNTITVGDGKLSR